MHVQRCVVECVLNWYIGMFVCLRIRACMSVRASVCPRGLHQALIIRVGGGDGGGEEKNMCVCVYC